MEVELQVSRDMERETDRDNTAYDNFVRKYIESALLHTISQKMKTLYTEIFVRVQILIH
jgi:hypothetical protein